VIDPLWLAAGPRRSIKITITNYDYEKQQRRAGPPPRKYGFSPDLLFDPPIAAGYTSLGENVSGTGERRGIP